MEEGARLEKKPRDQIFGEDLERLGSSIRRASVESGRTGSIFDKIYSALIRAKWQAVFELLFSVERVYPVFTGHDLDFHDKRSMPVAKLQKAPRTGIGALMLARVEEAVDFSLLLSSGLAGRKSGKGSLKGQPDILRQAFRAGECRLTLDDGQVLNIAVIAHTEGGEMAYFELR